MHVALVNGEILDFDDVVTNIPWSIIPKMIAELNRQLKDQRQNSSQTEGQTESQSKQVFFFGTRFKSFWIQMTDPKSCCYYCKNEKNNAFPIHPIHPSQMEDDQNPGSVQIKVHFGNDTSTSETNYYGREQQQPNHNLPFIHFRDAKSSQIFKFLPRFLGHCRKCTIYFEWNFDFGLTREFMKQVLELCRSSPDVRRQVLIVIMIPKCLLSQGDLQRIFHGIDPKPEIIVSSPCNGDQEKEQRLELLASLGFIKFSTNTLAHLTRNWSVGKLSKWCSICKIDIRFGEQVLFHDGSSITSSSMEESDIKIPLIQISCDVVNGRYKMPKSDEFQRWLKFHVLIQRKDKSKNDKTPIGPVLKWRLSSNDGDDDDDGDRNKGFTGLLVTGDLGKTSFLKQAYRELVLHNSNCLWIDTPALIRPALGESESLIRRLFSDARRNNSKSERSVIFLDNIEILAGKRLSSARNVALQERILTTLLLEMDGIGFIDKRETLSHVIVIAATSNLNDLDEAIVRPGRLQTVISL